MSLLPALVFCGACKQASGINTRERVRPIDSDSRVDDVDGFLKTSTEFSIADVTIRLVEEWLGQKPFNNYFSHLLLNKLC
jgi:hypothetical protein